MRNTYPILITLLSGCLSMVACAKKSGPGTGDLDGSSASGGQAGATTSGGNPSATGGISLGSTQTGGARAGAGTGATGGSAGQFSSGAAASSAAVAGVVSFNGDWDKDPAQGGWADIQVVDPAKLHKDPNTPTWHNRGAARVEVDSGDDPLNLATGTERAEVLSMQDSSGKQIPESEGSGTQYYAISYKFPTDWAGTEIAGDGTSWSIVFQLHGPDKLGYSPAFALTPQRPRMPDCRSTLSPPMEAIGRPGVVAPLTVLRRWPDQPGPMDRLHHHDVLRIDADGTHHDLAPR